MEKKIPLLNELLKYKKENNLILSMPGNKCGRGFLRDSIGEEFANTLCFLDITEVDPLDNLHCPEGVIKEAQDMLAKTYGAKKGYFLVNGSTSGNLAAIFSAFKEGDEILVERNCHKSIYNGIILRKLKVIYVEPVIDEENGILLPPNKENVYKALEKSKNPKGIIITHPNYFGISYSIEEFVLELKNRGLKIIIDGAHGAHFGFNEKLPKSIVTLGDYVVLSAHKTLPSLTQGGYLLVNEENSEIEFYLKAFMTTSPSYLIMASLDYGRYYLDNHAKDDYNKLIKLSEVWKEKINLLNKCTILSKESLRSGYHLDLTRYIMILEDGYSGHKLLDYLRENKIQGEMSFSKGVILILSPFNLEKDFLKIYNVMNNLNMEKLKDVYIGKNLNYIPEKIMEPYEIFEKEGTLINYRNAEGKVVKEAIIPYPPGVPLVCGGEIITKEVIDIIDEYVNSRRSIIGVKDNFINICK
ncbi:aminotransferase class V-fold PLP-dependent enzyme [Clostridium carnis]